MKSFKVFGVLIILLLIFISACRPPSLEQAIIDLNGGRVDQAFQSAQKAVSVAPENAEAWYYYGKIAGKKDDYKIMMEAYEKSLALKPTHKDDIEADKAQYFSKTYNGAVQIYNSYLKMEDKAGESGAKTLKNIIESFNKALIIKDDYQATRLIAISYGYLMDEENQINNLIRATEIAPDTALSWLELGYFYRNKKEYDKAEESFKKAIEVDPQNVNANTMLAEVLDFDGKKDEAIVQYKKAIEINSEEKAIPFNLGLLFYKESNADGLEETEKSKHLGDAATYFEMVYNLDPEFKEIYDLYSVTLIHLKRFEDAEQLLEEGVKYFPDAPSIWTNLSVVYANLGKTEKAKEAAKRATELAKEE